MKTSKQKYIKTSIKSNSDVCTYERSTTQITVLNYLHLNILNWLNSHNTKQFRPRQWLQNCPWIFKFNTFSTTLCNITVMHDENAVSLVKT